MLLNFLLTSTAFALDIVRVDVVAYQHGWVLTEASATLVPDGDTFRDASRGVSVPATAVADQGRVLDAPVVWVELTQAVTFPREPFLCGRADPAR